MDPDDDGSDPLAWAARLVEIAGLAVSVWYLYTILSRDPEFHAWRARVMARVQQYREQRRFSRVSTVAAEAAYILSEAQQ